MGILDEDVARVRESADIVVFHDERARPEALGRERLDVLEERVDRGGEQSGRMPEVGLHTGGHDVDPVHCGEQVAGGRV